MAHRLDGRGRPQGHRGVLQTPLRVALAGGSGSGDVSSVIDGGGEDLSRTTGQVRRADAPAERQTINLQAARAELARREAEQLESLKRRFEEAIQSNEKLAQFKNQIRLAITSEGLQITVVDEQNRAMFDTGGAVVKDYTRDVMRAIGGLLNDVENAISLAGHTDAQQYAGGERGYSNWELSADRANASRREVVAGGMRENKILRVAGLGSSLPLDANDQLNPMNRRISHVVLNEKTERQIRGLPEETMEQIENEADAADILGVDASAADGPAEQPPESTPPTGDRLAQPNAAQNPA